MLTLFGMHCSLSHHGLEDLLTEFPDAADYSEWVLCIEYKRNHNITRPAPMQLKQSLLGWRVGSTVFNGAIAKKLPPISRQQAGTLWWGDRDEDVD